MSAQQFQAQVMDEKQIRDEAGMTEDEADAYAAEQLANAAYEMAAERYDAVGDLDDQYAKWLMEPGRHLIGNGEMLINLMEAQVGLEDFLRGEK